MPVCRRCQRDQPRCEVRKTKLGYVCLEYGELRKFSRCAKLEKQLRAAAPTATRAAQRAAA
jgi:hypothetical protein